MFVSGYEDEDYAPICRICGAQSGEECDLMCPRNISGPVRMAQDGYD